MLVLGTLLHQFGSRLDQRDLCVLQRYQIEVLLLLPHDIFLVIEQLLSMQDKLPLLESMMVQRLLE